MKEIKVVLRSKEKPSSVVWLFGRVALVESGENEIPVISRAACFSFPTLFY